MLSFDSLINYGIINWSFLTELACVDSVIMEHFEIGEVSMLTLLRHRARQRVPTSATKYTFVRSAANGAK
jgi:hypothetical protein